MLFSSWLFIAGFLPLTWVGYRLLVAKAPREWSWIWLTVASLVFYGWFKWSYVLIIATSILFNHALGNYLARGRGSSTVRKSLLTGGIAANLGALVYYKYAGMFAVVINMAGGQVAVPHILLPLAISFFTFLSIAWLVDSYRRENAPASLLNYALFVTFFPHLIAGPIVHHKEIMPQFSKPVSADRLRRLTAMGLTLFAIGLFKKVAIADYLGEIADPIFTAAVARSSLTLTEAWLGPLAYTLQIYYDFSGYSDMAIGLAALFGVRMPVNFFSPYKAADVIEFWHRWHITLSRFLRDYLYIPLGGNRKGKTRRYFNLMLTMLLGGLWHGANWTFAVWGGLHGLYLVAAHAWKRLSPWRMPRMLGVCITFIAVLFAWIFFRMPDFNSALHLLSCMRGDYGFGVQDTHGAIARIADLLGFEVQHVTTRTLRLNEKWYIFWIALVCVFVFPSMQEVMRGRLGMDVSGVSQGSHSLLRFRWRPSLGWALATGFVFGVSLTLLTHVNAFIYFQF